MAEIETKGLPDLLAMQAAAAQSSARRALDFTEGSILLAFAEAVSAVALWFQAMLLRVLAVTRLATSRRGDVDTFVNEFGMVRRPAAMAQGIVTFARASTVDAAFVPVGALVRTGDGSATFAVADSPATTGYQVSPAGYVIPSGTASLAVPVAAVDAGTGGNVGIGTITLIASAIAGVDTVTNAAAMTGGAPAETDEEVKARFPLYVEALTDGTFAAVRYAVSQVQPGVLSAIIPNEDAAGVARGAHFTVVADDGSGAPSAGFLTRVGAAIETTRALGITYSVVAPTVTVANIALDITTSPGADVAAAIARAAAAVTAYRASLGIGAALRISRIPQVAYDADPAIINISSVTVNSGTADLDPGPRGRVVGGSVAVS